MDKKNNDKNVPDVSDCEGAEALETDANMGWLDKLQELFASRLKLDDSKKEQVLSKPTVEGIAEYIKSGNCQNIVTMAGAGISTSAGIPDFRSPGSGLYSNLAVYNLPYPEAIFEISFFRKNPKPFFVLAKDLYPRKLVPTPCHSFIRLLHDKGLLLRHYTQNIDTLEHVAGIPAEKIVEAHGTFRTSHCLQCKKEFDQDWVKDKIFSDEVPKCECSGVVKPDIVFFGENLPTRFFELSESDFAKCDLLIILGTSLTVQPFASLVDNVNSICPRLLINREKVSGGDPFLSMLKGIIGGGLSFDSKENKRDVAIIGDCDSGCNSLAETLGWKDDMDNLREESKENEDCASL